MVWVGGHLDTLRVLTLISAEDTLKRQQRSARDELRHAQNRALPLIASVISSAAKPIMAKRELVSSALGVRGPKDSSFFTPASTQEGRDW